MPRRTHVLVLSSLLAGGIVVGGGYVVNAATASTTIVACSKKKTGALRIVSPKAKCAKGEKRVTWNVKGADGARGLIGLTGPAGEPGAKGADGVDGAKGADGADGAAGPAGKDGQDGATGPIGPMGPAGPAGPVGGAAEVDPNPNDLTYRMQIGSDPAVEIVGFTQEVSQSGTTHMGTGGGAGKATIGDIVATLPLNDRIMGQMNQLAKGTHVPRARFVMCKPGEGTKSDGLDLGQCTLSIVVDDVLVTGLDVQQDPTQATVTVQLNFAKERVAVLPGTPKEASLTWDVAGNVMESSSGTAVATSTGDTAYTTTITGGSTRGVLSTRSWGQSSTQSGTTHTGGGGGAGKASFSDIDAETRSGFGTLALFRALVTGAHLPEVQLAGCESSTCVSTTVLNDVLVSGLKLGSPTLFDQVQLNYAKITWERADSRASGYKSKTFSWDIAANTE